MNTDILGYTFDHFAYMPAGPARRKLQRLHTEVCRALDACAAGRRPRELYTRSPDEEKLYRELNSCFIHRRRPGAAEGALQELWRLVEDMRATIADSGRRTMADVLSEGFDGTHDDLFRLL